MVVLIIVTIVVILIVILIVEITHPPLCQECIRPRLVVAKKNEIIAIVVTSSSYSLSQAMVSPTVVAIIVISG